VTNEDLCPHCHLPRQGAHSCMQSMQAEIARLRGALQVIAGRNSGEGAAAREALGMNTVEPGAPIDTDALSNEWPANWWREMMKDVNARDCKWPGLRNEVRDWIQAYANRPAQKSEGGQ